MSLVFTSSVAELPRVGPPEFCPHDSTGHLPVKPVNTIYAVEEKWQVEVY